jgi:hypothetical protein
MTVRMGKVVPWYHKPAPQCYAILPGGDQCLFTSTHSAKKETVFLCTVHAKMAKFKVKRIVAEKVILR